MSYKTLKNLGCAGWAFTYVCFIAIAYNWHCLMIPLVICSYNIAYEFLYTVTATERGQRIRIGVWFILDVFIMYNYIINSHALNSFLFWFSIMVMVQIVLNKKISREVTKSFSWISTLIMAVILVYQPPTFYSNWVVAALIGKILGDGFYGLANGLYGIPGVKEKSLYDYFLKLTMILSFILNSIALFFYVKQF